MAEQNTGYKDERFHQTLSSSFHCCICTNVFKDPVMCAENEHIFCRGCITRHLTNSQKCPTCMEPLTVKTLTPAPRSVRNLLSELMIQCEFFDRGCGKVVELGDLESHTKDCGFAPVVCTNEGCNVEVNKQDLFHHETSVCELRKVKCHSCEETRQDMAKVKAELAAMKVTLSGINKKLDRNESKVARVLKSLEAFERAQEDIVKMKKSLTEITELLITRQGHAESFPHHMSMPFGNSLSQPPFSFH
ncbi:E3 ubiquitin-protein ligase NRDP1-like [Dendronephthya gigantea]|uniref:E3 ubiquitin-protein ligase NRDP1-like n=1 Tax=Dendronephthya gigantea TaxID=151771 RepID=UPI00106D6035|nr:E3 ubiquitin-protein ligase NRDP1-like [Dendronephthya gigantea]